MLEELSYDLQEGQTVPDTPTKLVTPIDIYRAPHVTAIQETACDESQWHIARLPKISLKACFTQQHMTKKKCTIKIVKDNKSTVIPTYISKMVHYKSSVL
jgi:hypothetical protein